MKGYGHLVGRVRKESMISVELISGRRATRCAGFWKVYMMVGVQAFRATMTRTTKRAATKSQ